MVAGVGSQEFASGLWWPGARVGARDLVDMARGEVAARVRKKLARHTFGPHKFPTKLYCS